MPKAYLISDNGAGDEAVLFFEHFWDHAFGIKATFGDCKEQSVQSFNIFKDAIALVKELDKDSILKAFLLIVTNVDNIEKNFETCKTSYSEIKAGINELKRLKDPKVIAAAIAQAIVFSPIDMTKAIYKATTSAISKKWDNFGDGFGDVFKLILRRCSIRGAGDDAV